MKSHTWTIFLTLLVLLSLALNALLLYVLWNVQSAALVSLTEMRNQLISLSRQPLTMQVHLEQDVPLETTVPISQTMNVPLDFDYPLSTVVNTSFNVPLLGKQEVAIPIETIIPIQYTVAVPLQMEVPISFTYHLETDLPVQVQPPAELGAQLDSILARLEQSLPLHLLPEGR